MENNYCVVALPRSSSDYKLHGIVTPGAGKFKLRTKMNIYINTLISACDLNVFDRWPNKHLTVVHSVYPMIVITNEQYKSTESSMRRSVMDFNF